MFLSLSFLKNTQVNFLFLPRAELLYLIEESRPRAPTHLLEGCLFKPECSPSGRKGMVPRKTPQVEMLPCKGPLRSSALLAPFSHSRLDTFPPHFTLVPGLPFAPSYLKLWCLSQLICFSISPIHLHDDSSWSSPSCWNVLGRTSLAWSQHSL